MVLHMQKVIAIVGPTASGKTALSIFLAKKLQGEIISADSRQVYKGLNIGTGKVTKLEMASIPHHALDVVSPKKQFDASDFVQKGEQAITMIYHSEHTPIVVGGTGFYIDTLLGRMTLPEVAPDEKLRTQLEKRNVTQLFLMLQKLDPRRAKTIEPQHKRRLIRAIEIAKALGQSPLPQSQKKYEVLWLGMSLAPAQLQKNIHTRLHARLRQGMIAEAKRLHQGGLTYKRMEALGLEYRYLALLLQKKITRAQFEKELESAINKYAKRQIRWFKRNPEIKWVKNKTDALRLAKEFLPR